MGRHHGRQDQSDDARNENGAGKGKSEFTKERAGQSALQCDWSVNRGKRDRHRDDGRD